MKRPMVNGLNRLNGSNNMVTLTIDGKKVTVEEGATILKAAQELGIEIPTFCFHDKLEPVGSCRMCLVEVEKMGKLQVACATPVSEGMVVKTDTPRVRAARKGVLEFLLINHPLDCPVCDKGGECELQNLVFKYGSDKSRYVEEKRRFSVDPKSRYDDLTVGPQIIRNMNRCILCRKCVRFLTEIAGEVDLGTFGRGSKTEIGVLPDIPVDNPYSGNVVEICPVGALTSKSFRYKIRVWQTETTPSLCPLCGDGCNIKLWAKDDKIYRITSRRNDLIDEGFLCDKGRFGFEFVNHPDRLKHPLIKKDGELSPADWDEATELVTSKFGTTKKQSGSGSLAGVGSTKLTNEECYIFQKFFRVVLGTNNIDHRINSKHLLPSPTLKANQQAYTMTNSISQIEKAKLIFVLGCDLQKEHPIITLRVIKSVRKGNALFLANPESTRLNRFAQDELLYKKDTEPALINGVTREIIEEKLFDTDKTVLSENEMEKLRGKVQSLDSEKVSQASGIALNQIKNLAHALAKAESIMILCGREISSHPQNTEIIDSLHDLLRLTGHQDKDNCGVNLLWQGCNSQGAMDCGVLPDRLPGYVDISDEVLRKKVEEIWKAKIPRNPGFDFNLLLEAAHQGKIKAMYIVGADPVSEYPDRDYVKDALKKLDFLVVQDIFLTETAKLAHVILPGASFAEKDGTFTSVERRVQKLGETFDPLANCRADWYIICMLAQAMGYEFEYTPPAQIFEELTRVSPIHSNLSWEDLGESGKQWVIEEGR
ncbi:MAG: NADH-quinone oxidoreductase subunit NuoG [candidate division Zixibacteria bacterium]|nr:NADH-quinone oxidoreductase subunit NuoG [candidate division Zixibacteria bacterium]